MAKNESDKKIQPTDPTAPAAESAEAAATKEAERKTARHAMSRTTYAKAR